MNLLIIEDEEPASERLNRMIKEIEPSVNILETIVSVKSAVAWLGANPQPDLVFMDIQLADGVSFDIFRQATISCPVIFTTAYDQYAIEAFKYNGIDYLLKPVKKDALAQAISKYKKHYAPAPVDYSQLLDVIRSGKEYQKRIIIRYRDVIKAVEIEQVAYAFVENKITFLVTHDKLQYSTDMNLDELEKILDPKKFFRINRQFIVNIKSIEKMVSYTKSRVKLLLTPPAAIETIVSTERSPEFKEWLLGK